MKKSLARYLIILCLLILMLIVKEYDYDTWSFWVLSAMNIYSIETFWGFLSDEKEDHK